MQEHGAGTMAGAVSSATRQAERGGEVSRRAVVVGAAWTIPAVVAVSATPAYAASGRTARLSTPSNQAPASGPVTVSAAITDGAGQPVAGEAVSFSGPAGATFTPVSATTDSTGTATTSLDLATPWAAPGSTTTLSAIAGAASVSQAIVVLGANVVAAGKTFSSTFAQLPRVFPAPIVQAQLSTSDGRGDTAMVLLSDGSVWARGDNRYGLLGDGTTTSRSTWGMIQGLSDVRSISLTGYFVLALLGDGTVRAWGANSSGQCGDGTTTSPRTRPVAVRDLTSVTQVEAGPVTGYALAGGRLFSWGSGYNGERGDGSRAAAQTVPAVVPGLSQVTQVQTHGQGAYALAGGEVFGWGANSYGQLGNGTTDTSLIPGKITGLSGSTQIASAMSAGYALSSTGAVMAWGANYNGQCGDGTTTDRRLPVAVSGLGSGVTKIFGTFSSGFAVMSDGTLRGWGRNSAGEFGDGTTGQRTTPGVVSPPVGFPGIDTRHLSGTGGPALFLIGTVPSGG